MPEWLPCRYPPRSTFRNEKDDQAGPKSQTRPVADSLDACGIAEDASGPNQCVLVVFLREKGSFGCPVVDGREAPSTALIRILIP